MCEDGLAGEKSSDELVASTQNLCHQRETDTGPLSVSQHKPEAMPRTVNNFNIYLEEAEPVSIISRAPPAESTPVRYYCVECCKSYKCNTDLKCHMRMHKGEHPYQCPECGKSFPYSCKLKAHRRSHTGERRYVCRECDKSFIHSSGLRLHNLFHTGERPYQCTECGKGFISLYNLNQHRLVHADEKPYRCEQCNMQFRPLSSYSDHLLMRAGALPYRCTECCGAFKSLSNSKRRHHKCVKAYWCTECSKSFRRRDRMQEHMLRHREQCFVGSSLAEQQLRKQQEMPLFSFVCAECNTTYASKKILYTHVRRCHSQQAEHRPVQAAALAEKESSGHHSRAFLVHKCTVGSDSFNSTNRFDQHQMTHTGERRFDCNCSLPFLNQNHPVGHQAARAYDKNRSVLAKEQLTWHIASNWSSQSQGMEHIEGCQRILGKDLVFKCRHCVKIFADGQSVREHVLATHVPIEAQFGCSRCMSSFQFAHEAMACFLGHGRTVRVMLNRIIDCYS